MIWPVAQFSSVSQDETDRAFNGSRGKHKNIARVQDPEDRRADTGTEVAVPSSRRWISLAGCLSGPWVSPAACAACCSWAHRVLLHLDFIHAVIVSQLCRIKETYCKKTVNNYIRTNLGVRFYILFCLFRIFFQTWISGTFYFLTEREK